MKSSLERSRDEGLSFLLLWKMLETGSSFEHGPSDHPWCRQLAAPSKSRSIHIIKETDLAVVFDLDARDLLLEICPLFALGLVCPGVDGLLLPLPGLLAEDVLLASLDPSC